jgi:predicted signal transduction protein with EAL and GGDEF domain/DNA-binding response OmpR family regulator
MAEGESRERRLRDRVRSIILYVEDNPVERTLVSRLLTNTGFEVETLERGDQVLAATLELRPDLILLDAVLHEMDGFEVCERLRAHPLTRYLPVVMLTGLHDMASIDRAYQAGATDFMTKPINHALLIHRIRYQLRARDALQRLRLSRESLAAAQRVARMGHWELQVDKDRLMLSEELRELYQLPPAGDDGSGDLRTLLAACHPDDRFVFQRAIRNALEGPPQRLEHRVIYADGSERTMEMHLALSAAEGVVDHEDRHLIGISLDITARKETEREMLRLAYFDRLADLPNRSLLELVLDQEIPRAHLNGAQVGLIVIDLDMFSLVNNALGHSAGDAVLRQVATRLARLIATLPSPTLLDRLALSLDLLTDWQGGLLARLGGDLFVMLVGGHMQPHAEIAGIAERVVRAFEQPFVFRGQEVFLTASLGIALSDSASCPAETLLQWADLALRDAKRAGRNSVREYHGALVAHVSRQMSMQSDLRRALARGEFEVCYQPKLKVKRARLNGVGGHGLGVYGEVAGFEALIRWRHPQRGQVSPAEFIAIAEETGQIVDIGRWVLQAACHQFRQWTQRGLVQGRVAVNMSARQFRSPHLVSMVLSVLEQTGLPPQQLELEITEGVLMSEPRASDIIGDLRRRGISIALDDFGTGFSSLSYLTRFAIDTLKIDRCFVHGITQGSDQAAIVHAVTALSHQLRLKVIAEGVETADEWQMIDALECDEVQGYWVCQPLPVGAVEGWLAGQRAALAGSPEQDA